MVFDQFTFAGNLKIRYSRFRHTSTEEYHLMVTPDPGGSAGEQFKAIDQGISSFVTELRLEHAVVLFRRLFVSDIANQMEEIHSGDKREGGTTWSIIQQPPALGNKMSAWVYLVNFRQGKPGLQMLKYSLRMDHNGYQHLFTTNLTPSQSGDAYLQTKDVFAEYLDILKSSHMTLRANCLRTWIFVRDIDNNYSGMVKARNDVFTEEGLTGATHFIASTGIEGQTAVSHSLAGMDAYAAGGLESAQITYLKGNSHLSPTKLYGVSFERGTAIDYGDRRHIFISGTASINQYGNILHERDIKGQMLRVFENMKVLLEEGGATFSDVSSMIVYLRDLADSASVHSYLESTFSGIPYLVVIAPICRQGWLFEAECTAILERSNPDFGNF